MTKKKHDHEEKDEGLKLEDPQHQQLAEELILRGVERDTLKDWVKKYGPSIFDVLKLVLGLAGAAAATHPEQMAARGRSPAG